MTVTWDWKSHHHQVATASGTLVERDEVTAGAVVGVFVDSGETALDGMEGVPGTWQLVGEGPWVGSTRVVTWRCDNPAGCYRYGPNVHDLPASPEVTSQHADSEPTDTVVVWEMFDYSDPNGTFEGVTREGVTEWSVDHGTLTIRHMFEGSVMTTVLPHGVWRALYVL